MRDGGRPSPVETCIRVGETARWSCSICRRAVGLRRPWAAGRTTPFVAKRSSGAGDPRDRGVAVPIVQSAGSRAWKRSCRRCGSAGSAEREASATLSSWLVLAQLKDTEVRTGF